MSDTLPGPSPCSNSGHRALLQLPPTDPGGMCLIRLAESPRLHWVRVEQTGHIVAPSTRHDRMPLNYAG
jgi:hypothetical protein